MAPTERADTDRRRDEEARGKQHPGVVAGPAGGGAPSQTTDAARRRRRRGDGRPRSGRESPAEREGWA